MSSPALSIANIVDVVVQVSPIPLTAPTFNIGACVGSSSAISHTQRMIALAYATWSTTMLNAGFTTTSPEYIAMELYFGANEPPQVGYVGRQDLTSLATVIPHSGNAGTGYVVGDIINVVQTSASGGQVQVTTINTGGVVTGLQVVTLNDGTGYSAATGLSTTGGTGTGLEVDISAVGETPLVAIENCRALFSQPYAYMSTTAADADHIAIAAYAQSQTMMYFAGSSTSSIPTNSTSDVASVLAADDYDRVYLTYSTTQGGLFPNNIYVAAAQMGLMMGLNSGLAGSYFTMFGKELPGISTEPVNTIIGKNCNIYTLFGPFKVTQTGRTPSGTYADQVLFIDVLTVNIQYNVMDALLSLPAIPLTDAGEQQAIHAVNNACQSAVAIGFISPGIWEGITIMPAANNPNLGIEAGDALSAGYEAFAAPIAQLSQGAIAARQLQPIYVPII